jgi:hypothetical protein
MPFTLSIEETAGKCRQHGFHLGTDEKLARQIVMEKLAAYRTNALPVVTMALMRKGKIVDVLYADGTWHNA